MKWLRNIVCLPIRFYRWTLSPLKQALLGPGAGCRFRPTCSIYAIQAIQNHGVGRGGILALKRILRCHPWGGHGWDPVPPHRPTNADSSRKKSQLKQQDRIQSSWTPSFHTLAGTKQK